MDARHKMIAMALLGQRDEDVDRYHRCLGEFVSEFSHVEALMQTALWRIARVNPPIAQAIFSGVKIEGTISNINRIADGKKWSDSKKEKYKFVFDQLQHINKLRNDILHKGTVLQADGTRLSTNAIFAHTPEKIRSIPVSAEILEYAKADLFEIRMRIVFLIWGARRMPSDLKSRFQNFLKHAWQYKPVPQGRKSNTNRQSRRREQRQPKSSLE